MSYQSQREEKGIRKVMCMQNVEWKTLLIKNHPERCFYFYFDKTLKTTVMMKSLAVFGVKGRTIKALECFCGHMCSYTTFPPPTTLDKTHNNSSLFELLTVKKLPLISYSVTSTVFISTTKITGCEQMGQIWIKRLKWDDTIATEIELVFFFYYDVKALQDSQCKKNVFQRNQ